MAQSDSSPVQVKRRSAFRAFGLLVTASILAAGPAAGGGLTVNVTGTKTVSGVFYVGSAVFYTVVLTNGGTGLQGDNPGPEFTDVLPSELTLVGASANFGTASTSGNTVNWNGQIPAGGSITITITANITATAGDCPAVISNQGTIFYDADVNGTNESTALTDDPGTAAANDPTSFTFNRTPLLSATKGVSGTPREFQNISYTVVITNSGCGAQPDDPNSPEFSDFLSPFLTFVSASAVGNPGPAGTATFDPNSAGVTWNGTIPSGGTVTLTIVAMVNFGSAGQPITNQGVVSFDLNGDGTNDTGAVTDDPATPAPGDPTVVIAQAAFLAETPTLSGLGLSVLAIALAGTALLLLRRRRTA
ncbi:MAG TPA: hypothetical protein VLK88_03965 [Gemmatimonadales bacterium]|nr:hypothetical protein [Gemmatimonadales bacterium]